MMVGLVNESKLLSLNSEKLIRMKEVLTGWRYCSRRSRILGGMVVLAYESKFSS
jgi:hypothetical protein